jgi:hypothetical protein
MITIAQFFLDLFTLQYCLGPGLQRDRGNFSKQKSAKSTPEYTRSGALGYGTPSKTENYTVTSCQLEAWHSDSVQCAVCSLQWINLKRGLKTYRRISISFQQELKDGQRF